MEWKHWINEFISYNIIIIYNTPEKILYFMRQKPTYFMGGHSCGSVVDWGTISITLLLQLSVCTKGSTSMSSVTSNRYQGSMETLTTMAPPSRNAAVGCRPDFGLERHQAFPAQYHALDLHLPGLPSVPSLSRTIVLHQNLLQGCAFLGGGVMSQSGLFVYCFSYLM